MPIERVALERVVESVADGTADIDWDAIEANLQSARDRQLLRQLRVLARISDVHRSHPDAEPLAEPPSVLMPDGDESVSKVIGRIEPQTLPPVAVAAGDGQLPPRDIPTRWGHLEIRERVGQGTFGEVFRAFDTQLHREVALKLLRAGSSPARLDERVLREGRILARLRHPNVVGVYGAESREGRVGLWMEYIRGATLEGLLRLQGAFSAREAAVIGQDLCRAVAAVHAAGLVHRDIKAQNVMREEGGRVVLMDFGAGQYRAESSRGTARLTGTPLYLAPEVLNGGEATPASDIYSIGVLLYRLVTNGFPVRAGTLDELRAAHRNGRVHRLHDVRAELPDAFVQVVERALSPRPEDRPRTPGELLTALTETAGARARPPFGPESMRERRPRWAVTLAMAALVTATVGLIGASGLWPGSGAVRSVAVLAAEPDAEDTDAQAFTAGLVEHLSTTLTKVTDLRVPAPSTVSRYRAESPVAAGRALNVDAILELSHAFDRSSPEHVRVRLTARLIRAGTGEQLWAESYIESVRNWFDLQERLARDIGAQVQARTAPQPGGTAMATGVNEQALREYYLGRFFMSKMTEPALRRAVGHFQRAVETAPTLALAHAGIAEAQSYLRGNFGALPFEPALASATSSAERAVSLDDGSSEAHAALGWVTYYLAWDWTRAEREFQRALELNPGDVTARNNYADLLNVLARQDEALAERRRALESDPASVGLNRDLAWLFFFRGDYGQAAGQLSMTLTLDPVHVPSRTLLFRAQTALGRHTEAIAGLESVIAEQGPASYQEMLAYAYAKSGQRARAEQALNVMVAAAQTQYVKPYGVALVHLALGRPDSALDWLERAYEERDATLVNIKVDPRLGPLRSQPRFRALVTRMNL